MSNNKNNQKASVNNQTNNYKDVVERVKSTFQSMVKELKKNTRRLDKTIIVITTALIIIGIISVFSATIYEPTYAIVTNQILSVIIGVILVVLILAIPYNWFENIYLLMTLLLIIAVTLIFLLLFGTSVSGSTSWLSIMGLSFQPSEFVKILGILLMAWMMEYSNEELIVSDKNIIKNPSIWIGTLLIIVSILILMQPDLGMTLIIASTLIFIHILINTSKKINFMSYGIIIAVYIVVIIFGQYFGDQLVNQNNHILDRLGSFINPFKYPTDSGYQLIQGMLALSRGGLFGVGIGQGIGKEGILPVIESDYIIANIGEETGLLGVFIVLALLLSLKIVLLQRAAISQSIFRKSVLIGIGLLLFIQTVVNIGGVLSVMPLTGVTLPFISAGGSSMIVSISLVGIALRMIAQDRKETAVNLVYSRESRMSDGI